MAAEGKPTDILPLSFSGGNGKVHKTLEKSGFYRLLGKENICPNIYVALEHAGEIMQ